jgi:hypothetical protein
MEKGAAVASLRVSPIFVRKYTLRMGDTLKLRFTTLYGVFDSFASARALRGKLTLVANWLRNGYSKGETSVNCNRIR